MRVDDRTLPTIGGPRPTGGSPASAWPIDLYIGLDRQPVANYVYDDYTASYDATPPDFVYDDVQAWPYDRFDLTCYCHGLTITTGGPDADEQMAAGHVELTLDNHDGQLSQYDAQGRLVDWVPGAALDIWAVVDGDPCWLFSGQITAWRERADGSVDAEAFDAFSRLSEELPEWDPGFYGDTVTERLDAILASRLYTGPTRFDVGDVTLHSYLTTASPLGEMQSVAISDGGLLFVDADGTLIYRNRHWLTGRADQTVVPSYSDNYCSAPHVVWDAEMTTDDDRILNRVTLTSVADVSVSSTDQSSINLYGPQTLARSSDQWITETEGQALADYIVARRRDAYLRLEQYVLYLTDPMHDLWRTGIDRRLGDMVIWIHEQETTTGVNLVVLNLIVESIVHDITPTSWVTTVGTTRTIGNILALRYDQTTFVYDQPDPRNIYAA